MFRSRPVIKQEAADPLGYEAQRSHNRPPPPFPLLLSPPNSPLYVKQLFATF